jgi:putative membrane-bound dehydrogenase-like protein
MEKPTLLTILGLATVAQAEEWLLPASEAAMEMQLPDGFTAKVFAAEPDVVQPVAMCLDDRGRLWVAENNSYPKHTDQPANDRILIFEDSDQDGHYDNRTVFYDKLNYVSGIEVGFGGAWVISPPYFYFIPDQDGDDKPDCPPKVLLDGFGNFANSHNIANGFAWGPDGWLYGTHGRTNWSLPGKPSTPKEDREQFDGGVWRYHPTKHIWEPYADGCTNPWGIDWDDYGQAFIPNTVGPHIYHVIQGAHYEPWRNRKSSQYAYQRIDTIADHYHFFMGKKFRYGLGTPELDKLGGGHSHCGILIYKGDNWPDAYRNTAFLHNTHGKRINNDTLERKGSGYVASHKADFMRSADPWFMGVSFRTNYDGTVYISDWSDTGECHSTKGTRKHTGRIYRIHYGEAPRKVPPCMDALDNAAIAVLQTHKNEWYARHSRRILQERAHDGQDMAGARATLLEIFSKSQSIPHKLRALDCLYCIGSAPEDYLQQLLGHQDEHIRARAVKLLLEDKSPTPETLSALLILGKNSTSPFVRLHLASALQRIPPAQRWDLAGTLLAWEEDSDDPNLPLLYWYGIEPLVKEDEKRFVRLVATTKIPLVRQFITRRVAEK